MSQEALTPPAKRLKQSSLGDFFKGKSKLVELTTDSSKSAAPGAQENLNSMRNLHLSEDQGVEEPEKNPAELQRSSDVPEDMKSPSDTEDSKANDDGNTDVCDSSAAGSSNELHSEVRQEGPIPEASDQQSALDNKVYIYTRRILMILHDSA